MDTATQQAAPPISVIIASWSGEKALSRCLDSLLPQSDGAEVIVATNASEEVVLLLGKRFPQARFVRGDRNATVFELRALGAAKAGGEIIAQLEDHTTVSPRWRDALLGAHAEGRAIMGGPVDNGLTSRAYDWALYFCEYGIYMPPLAAGPAQMLSGLNVAYDRDVLASCRAVWEHAFYETDVHGALQAAGRELYLVPEAWVKSHLEMPLREAMIHLFGGGHHFGAFRKAHSSGFSRMLWILASPLVPLVLLAKIVRRVARTQPARLKHVFQGLPYLFLLLGAWGVGEAFGYLDQRPARAFSKSRHQAPYAHRH